MKDPANRDDLSGLLRDLTVRLERQSRHTHMTGRGGPSGDNNNAARVGSDGLIYANEILGSQAPPTNTDFAADQIPHGSIWVEAAPPYVRPEPLLRAAAASAPTSAERRAAWEERRRQEGRR